MKRLFIASILATAFASGAGYAQVTVPPGLYVGASIGQNNYGTDLPCVGTCDKTDTMGKIFGGWMFSPYLGVELAYGALGTMKINTVEQGVNELFELKSSAFSGFLVGQYPVDAFRLFGKIGFAYVDAKVTLTVPQQPATNGVIYARDESDKSTEFAWGIGGIYMINKNLGVRAEYEQMKYNFGGFNIAGRDLVDIGDKMRIWSIGVQWNF